MITSRISALRSSFKSLAIDGFVIPKVDMFMGEYIRPCDERLAWISGFTGSAGLAVITRERATLFVDSRYTLQAAEQCPDFEILDLYTQPIKDIFPYETLGFDPRFLSYEGAQDLGAYKLIPENPIDQIWHDRPRPQPAILSPLDIALAGHSHEEKLQTICKTLQEENLDAFITNAPEDTAWLLNIRGGENATVPAPHVISIIYASGKLKSYSDGQFEGLKTQPLETLTHIKGRIGFDPKTLPLALHEMIETPIALTNPLLRQRACKNTAEIKATEDAHIQDAIAFMRFWKWLDAQDPISLDELKIVDKLWSFRQDVGARAPSFDTIAGFNQHGAIVHYRADETSNLKFNAHGLLLLDSGAHYQGATTDITRTLAIGDGREDAKKPFTLVLSALAHISQARFPKGLAGRDIDALARAPLWAHGLDYGHGTGHGVGAQLSVHEGPQSLSRKSTVPFEAGMIISLEPGYYQPKAFGIRHENLAVVRENEGFLHFEPLTFVPFDHSMLDPNVLTPDVKSWLNDYHHSCFKKLKSHMDEAHLTFLMTKCHIIDT